jgi:hypothetical protein
MISNEQKAWKMRMFAYERRRGQEQLDFFAFRAGFFIHECSEHASVWPCSHLRVGRQGQRAALFGGVESAWRVARQLYSHKLAM